MAVEEALRGGFGDGAGGDRRHAGGGRALQGSADGEVQGALVAVRRGLGTTFSLMVVRAGGKVAPPFATVGMPATEGGGGEELRLEDQQTRRNEK